MDRLDATWWQSSMARFRPVYFRFCTRCWGCARSFLDNSSSKSEREPTFNRKQIRRILWSLQLPAGSSGLFNNFTLGQSASIPPLALAFLIGFSVDVFLSFLETLSQSFMKRSDSEPRSKPVPAST